MMKPNYMDKLLDGVEVEWKTLRDVTLPTSNIRWSDTKDTYRYIDLTSVSREKNTIIETTEISAENAPSRAQKLVVKNDVIFATTRPTQQRLCLITEDFSGEVASTGYCILRARTDEVLPKWIYHCITSSEFKKYVEENQSGSAYPAISDAKVKEFKIPIPSLKVQEEIIRILDSFSELTAKLTAELTAELTARKKQYTYYRDKLLTFDEGEVEWKTLGEIALVGTGSRNTNESISDGHYPFFVRSQEPRTINEYEFDETAIITAGDGVGVGKVFHFISGKYALHQRAYRIVVTNRGVLPKFLFHFIRNDFARYLTIISVHASVTSLRKPMFERYQIPIPSITEQERIVSILDKFDVLTSSITEGLIREIELRQKQYEYYSNMLLNFPKEEVEA